MKLNKKAQAWETFLEMIPKIILFFIIVTVITTVIIKWWLPQKEISRAEKNLNLIAGEVPEVQENERMSIPIFKPDKSNTEYRFVLQEKGSAEISDCKDEACVCVIELKEGKNIRTECTPLPKTDVKTSCTVIADSTDSPDNLYLKKESGKVYIDGICT